MSDAQRKVVLQRRAGGGNDLRKITLASGNMTVDDALKKGMWTINATQAIGIATATEQGLSYDRYPIRIVLRPAPGETVTHDVQTCIRYWGVYTLDWKPHIFSRRPIEDTLPIENLYKFFEDLDSEMWNFLGENKGLKAQPDAEVTAISDAIFGFLQLPAAPAESVAACRAELEKLKVACRAKKIFPYLRIAPNNFVQFRANGYGWAATKTMTGEEAEAYENILNVKVNNDRIAARYADRELEPGVALTAAYAIAGMFRFGLMEAFESQEFYTAYVSPVAGSNRLFSVTQVVGPPNAPACDGIAAGFQIDISATTIDTNLLQIGPGLCVSAGLNHYMFNHTTGGTIASGAVLTTLAMFSFFDVGEAMLRKVGELVTSVFYEALHPVNKRGIANIFFKRSRVTTHGRLIGANRIEQMAPDSFLSIRMHPQPAGAHKAYVLAAALKRIVQGGLAVFLPWAAQINDCITQCANVLHGGAEAHIGSFYYTGRHGLTQSSSLDQFLPEVAYFMQNICSGDSLTMSPHLGKDVAARAQLSWINIIKGIKGQDFSTIDKEKVKGFLAGQGKITIDFNIEDPADWGKATEMGNAALAALRQAME